MADKDTDATLARELQLMAEVARLKSAQEAKTGPQDWWTPHAAATMCAMVLVFGAMVIGISAWLAVKRIDRDAILKAVVVPMAVMSAVFLTVAGYDDKQMIPAIGLLGTIVGYVLGSSRPSTGKDESPTKPGSE